MQSEYGNILCEMISQSKELEDITYIYGKKFGMVPSTVQCHIVQNDYPEWCSNMCYSKWWVFSCFFNNKIPLCKACLITRLSNVIPPFKNSVVDKGGCRVCGDWWTDLLNKNRWFLKYKDYPTVKGRKEGNRNEANINIPKAPDKRPVDKKAVISNF